MEATASYVSDVQNLKATELRLGLPGAVDYEPQQKTALPRTPTSRGSKRALAEETSGSGEAKKSDEAAPPAAKAQVVGWPPVRAYRKSCFQACKSKAQEEAKNTATITSTTTTTTSGNGLYVKVSMDGAPYLRKIDLKMYKGYRELREVLEAMFMCFSGLDGSNNSTSPSEFAVTYEDKDGDLMLVGDVPFDMFASTCKRLRIMKASEATSLGSSIRQ